MDGRSFVAALIAAVPEAFDGDDDAFDEDGALAYPALGNARSYLEDHAIRIHRLPLRASVRPGGEDVLRRFWDFVEEQAQAGAGDERLETLLQIECFEGVGWVEDLIEFVRPRTRELLADAQVGLADANGQIGRWAAEGARRSKRR